jgi:hypothetical protein
MWIQYGSGESHLNSVDGVRNCDGKTNMSLRVAANETYRNGKTVSYHFPDPCQEFKREGGAGIRNEGRSLQNVIFYITIFVLIFSRFL